MYICTYAYIHVCKYACKYIYSKKKTYADAHIYTYALTKVFFVNIMQICTYSNH